MKIPSLRRLTPFVLAVPILLATLQCGPGTAIERHPLDTGESIILRFDGPFSYQYKVQGNPVAKVYNGSTQDEIQLKNNYSDTDPQDNLEESLVAHAGITYDNKLSIFPGVDPKLKTQSGNSTAFDEFNGMYKPTAYITNLKHPEDAGLDFDSPIEFSKNLVGITTIRREIVCVDGAGNPIPSIDNTKMPNLLCLQNSYKYTGETVSFDYSVDELKQLLGTSGEHKNSLIYVWHKGDPLTLTLKNIKAPDYSNFTIIPIKPMKPIYYFPNFPNLTLPSGAGNDPGNGNPSGNGANTGSAQGESGALGDSKISAVPDSPANTAASGNAATGQTSGCSLQPSTGHSSVDAWGWLLAIVASLAWSQSRSMRQE